MADPITPARYPSFREVPAEEAQKLAHEIRTMVADDLAIESVQTTRDQRQGAVVVQGRLLRPSHQVFTRWLTLLNQRGYTPMLRSQPGGGPAEVKLHILAGVAPKQPSNPWVNVILFVLTLISTLWVGSLSGDSGAVVNSASDFFLPQNIIRGWPFALSLLAILTAHEFGHYFAARWHKLAVTLPYFLPFPLPPIGTLGAFIRLKEPVPDLRKLFDIGVSGPLAGFIVAVPLLLYGLSTSPVMTPDPATVAWVEGNSILYYYSKLAVLGKALPNPLTGEDVLINQVTAAAWFGLLVTALNLLPVGQLDGGHTVFALFGEKARHVNRVAIGALVLLALASLPQLQQFLPALSSFGFTGWFVWLFLIFFMIGPYHPPPLDDVTRLDKTRRWIGYLVIAIFILTFVPVPLRFAM
ncbi:MAG: site-2 protease family protein [Caldilineaceae bacterium]|nr:site-2 protease family protein [Caldilineaceae bacterium]